MEITRGTAQVTPKMSDNISYLREDYRQHAEIPSIRDESKKGGGSEPPGGNNLEKRVEALEKSIPEIREKLILIESRMGNLESNMATKLDLASLATRDDFTKLGQAISGDIKDLAVTIQKQSTEFHKSLSDQAWKYIGFVAATATIAFTAARFMGH